MASAVSGLTADSTWLDAIASKVANVRSTSYQLPEASFSANASGGVSAVITPAKTPSFANMDPASAVVDQAMALQGYRANAAVFATSEKMMKTTLDMTC